MNVAIQISGWRAGIAGIALATLCSTAFGGCTIDDQGNVGLLVRGSAADFSTSVQPALGVSCGSLDCHGDHGRALTLYARNGLRMSAELRGKNLSAAELSENILAISGVDAEQGTIEDNLLLVKPLSVQAGGIGHVGGDIFADQRDPLYRCLHAWLRAGASDAAGRAVCKLATP